MRYIKKLENNICYCFIKVLFWLPYFLSGITDNYYIIVEQPLSISVPGIITSKFKNEPLAGCFRWFHEEYVSVFSCM